MCSPTCLRGKPAKLGISTNNSSKPLAADISAYKEGRAAGLSRGEKLGYANGRSDGYNEGFAAGLRDAQNEAWRGGVDSVLDQLKFRQFEFHDEMRYHEHLVESRRQSLISMIDLIDSIVSMFSPQQQSVDEPAPNFLQRCENSK